MSVAAAPRPGWERLRFGVLGTGSIAAEVTRALALSEHGAAELVASRDGDRAKAFAAEHGVRRSVGSCEDLLTDPDVDVVYVATPHSGHAHWTTAAIEAGKHVLCEKPLTVNEAEALAVVAVAHAHDAFLLKAFAYRFHPQTAALLELVADGAIGRLRAIDITFSYALPPAPALTSRTTAKELAGGGILDVGCYCTSMASRIVGAAIRADAVEPQEVVGLAALAPVERTDSYAAAVMRFPGDILAQCACGVSLTQDDHIRIYGSKGAILVEQPAWLGGRRDAASTIEVTESAGAVRIVDLPGGSDIFALQIDGLAAMVADGAPRATRPGRSRSRTCAPSTAGAALPGSTTTSSERRRRQASPLPILSRSTSAVWRDRPIRQSSAETITTRGGNA